MSNEITTGGAANAALQELFDGYAKLAAALPTVQTGEPYLKMNHLTGVWSYGADNKPTQEGSEWAVNPFSAQHGLTCWSERPRAKLHEVMVPATSPLPDIDRLPQHDFPYKSQVGFTARCTNGEDAGLQAKFSSYAHGGVQAFRKLFDEIMGRIKQGSLDVVPVVELGHDSYFNKQAGSEICVPVFTIVRWVNMDGATANAAIAAKAAATPAAATISRPPVTVVPTVAAVAATTDQPRLRRRPPAA